MSEKRSIWFGFIGSFSPKFYKEISHQPFARSFGYLVLLVLAISLVLSVKYTFDTRETIQKTAEWLNTEFAKKLPEFLPEINIKNGEVSSPAQQPLVHKWKEFAFVLDTTGNVTSVEEYKNSILITKHKFIVKYTEDGNRPKIDEYDLSKIKSFKLAPGEKEGEFITLNFEGQEFSLTEKTIVKWLHVLEKILFPVMIVGLFFRYLVAKFIHLFLFSLFSLIINNVNNVKLKYDNLLNIGVFAMTPPVVFAVLAGVLDFKLPLSGLIYIGLYSLFLIMAIMQFKTVSVEER
jgi:hypothetical protein